MRSVFLVLAACGSATYSSPSQTLPITLGPPSDRVVAIVRIPAPWYAPRFVIRRKFRAAIAEYERLADLERKYFTVSQRGEFGGIYLWRTRAAADAFYGPAWHARVRERYGKDTEVAVFDAPFVVEGATKLDVEPIDDQAASFPACATLVLGRGELAAFAAVHGIPPGLVRSYFVVAPDGRIGAIDLWASERLADAALPALERALAGETTRFDAPVLLRP
jgi:hypothetical protein